MASAPPGVRAPVGHCGIMQCNTENGYGCKWQVPMQLLSADLLLATASRDCKGAVGSHRSLSALSSQTSANLPTASELLRRSCMRSASASANAASSLISPSFCRPAQAQGFLAVCWPHMLQVQLHHVTPTPGAQTTAGGYSRPGLQDEGRVGFHADLGASQRCLHRSTQLAVTHCMARHLR